MTNMMQKIWKKSKNWTHDSDQPVEHKSRSRVMGTVMEWRNAFVFPRAVPLLKVGFAAGIQSSDRLKKKIVTF